MGCENSRDIKGCWAVNGPRRRTLSPDQFGSMIHNFNSTERQLCALADHVAQRREEGVKGRERRKKRERGERKDEGQGPREKEAKKGRKEQEGEGRRRIRDERRGRCPFLFVHSSVSVSPITVAVRREEITVDNHR